MIIHKYQVFVDIQYRLFLVSGGKENDLVVPKQTMVLVIDGNEFEINEVDNVSVRALKENLLSGPLELDLLDYCHIEKCACLDMPLPTNEALIDVDLGDVALHQDDQLVFYYHPNTYKMTPIGHIDHDLESFQKIMAGKKTIKAVLKLV